MTASVQFKSLHKMQIWLKTLILIGKLSKMASNSELYFDVNFGAGLYGI